MKRVKYFLKPLGWAVILWLLVGKITVMAAPVGSWSDSLRVDIVDSTVLQIGSSKYLQFSLIVQRVNADWNMPDTALGNCDFYFYANLEAFAGVPVFTYVHDSLNAGSGTGVGGDPDAILQANVGIWAERLHISLTRQDTGQGNAILGVVPKNTAKYKLQLTVGKVDTLCTVRWKLREPLAVNLGIIWDTGRRGATGLQTYGGNPILDTLFGDIKKIPSDLLDVDCMEENYYACEGSPLSVGLHAETTGEGLVFEWYDSIPGGGQAFPIVATAHTQDRTPALSGKNYKYDYSFSAQGDTLYIDQVPASIDSIYFYCLVKDTTLASRPAQWCKTQLFVRDSIKGFISPLNNNFTLNKIDTIVTCQSNEVDVRFNFYGTNLDELDEIDSIWFEYRCEAMDGSLTQDTFVFPVSLITPSNTVNAAIDGQTVYWLGGKVSGTGKFYINRMWTTYCDNAVPSTPYDTIFVEEGNTQMLERLTVMVGQTIIIDSTNSSIFDNVNFRPVAFETTNDSLGVVRASTGGVLPYRYIANSYSPPHTGLDTVIYKMEAGDRCSWIMREVEVQDLKYVRLKVWLEGPYIGRSNKMRCLLTRSNMQARILDTLKNASMSHIVSPYNSADSIELNQFYRLIDRVKLNDLAEFADWIYVSLRNVKNDGAPGNYIASQTFLLRDDGIICDTAGHSYIGFKNLPDVRYFVVIQHRNHLGIMSKEPITFENNPSALATISPGGDLTQWINVADGLATPFAPLKVVSNIGFMYAGDLLKSNNGRPSVISNSDLTPIKKKVKKPHLRGYYDEDIDFNTLITNTDETKVSGNAKNGIYEKY